jgi:ATP-dependent exoDNAse (exonuclease V) alpha subunit
MELIMLDVINAHSLPPETATKRVSNVEEKHLPKKRGRKSNKIVEAILNVPIQPVDAEAFAIENGITLNALRQYKRFYEQLDENVRMKLGTIKIRLNKTTRRLLIWREHYE